MADWIDQEIDAALARGARKSHEPRATSARYDEQSRCMVIALSNGCSFAFPAHLAEGLENATPEQLANVEVLGKGSGLHWEDLDVDLSVAGILAGLFGTEKYMAAKLARRAGSTKSAAKAAAARANGKLGGRPRTLTEIRPLALRSRSKAGA